MDLNSPPVFAQGYLVKDEPAMLAVTLHPSLGVQAWEENPVLAIAGLEFESEVSGSDAVWSLTDLDVADILLSNTSHRVRFAVLYAGMSIVAGQMKVLSRGTGLENPGLQGVRVVVGPPGPSGGGGALEPDHDHPGLYMIGA